jgi:hypothetical protein
VRYGEVGNERESPKASSSGKEVMAREGGWAMGRRRGKRAAVVGVILRQRRAEERERTYGRRTGSAMVKMGRCGGAGLARPAVIGDDGEWSLDVLVAARQ